MRESLFETLVGALVVAVAGVFLWFAIARGGEASAGPDRYDLKARFNNISGIERGADVRIAGVKAGVVKTIEGDPKRFEAVLTMSLDKKWQLPDDTDARISTDGLLGGAYVALEPGGSFDNIALRAGTAFGENGEATSAMGPESSTPVQNTSAPLT